jgi:hypothetical protein
VFAWARAARVVRVVKGRLVPVKSAAKLLADPLALAHRAFEAFFGVGEAVCGSGYAESLVRWVFDEVTFTVMMVLYDAQEPMDTVELHDVGFRTVEASQMLDLESPHADVWRRLCDNDVDRLLAQLALLGAVTLNDGVLEITALGAALVVGHLRRLGVDVPTVEDLLDETYARKGRHDSGRRLRALPGARTAVAHD